MQLKADNISFRYDEKSKWILRNVNITIEAGEKVALVGPSGYGKSTLSKILAGYESPVEGKVLLDNMELPKKGYCKVQMIYQHPEHSVNPRWKMEKILNESYKVDDNMLKEFGIEKSWLSRWPSELSGGELQRFCIARALGPETKFLICDEITTMLDVISQAQIWKVITKIVDKNKLGLVVITHNMELAKRVCDRIINLEDINKINEQLTMDN